MREGRTDPLPLTEFHAKKRAPDGTVIQYKSWCKRCNYKGVKESRKRLKNDPERLRRARESWRMAQTLIRRQAGIEPRGVQYKVKDDIQPHERRDDRVDIVPFAEWLQDQPNITALARSSGIDPEYLRRIANGKTDQKTITLGLVDKVLHACGGTTQIWELYEEEH